MKLILLSACAILAIAQATDSNKALAGESRGIQLGGKDQNINDLTAVVTPPLGISLGLRRNDSEDQDQIEQWGDDKKPAMMKWLAHGKNSGIQEIDDDTPSSVPPRRVPPRIVPPATSIPPSTTTVANNSNPNPETASSLRVDGLASEATSTLSAVSGLGNSVPSSGA